METENERFLLQELERLSRENGMMICELANLRADKSKNANTSLTEKEAKAFRVINDNFHIQIEHSPCVKSDDYYLEIIKDGKEMIRTLLTKEEARAMCDVFEEALRQ